MYRSAAGGAGGVDAETVEEMLHHDACARSMTMGHQHRRVCLHHGEHLDRADTEQEHAIGRLQRTHHLPAPLQH
jgi:hypothetical protein